MSMEERRDRAGASVTINLRASTAQRSVIDRAAKALGKTRTEFMLEAAGRMAEDALLDRRLFLLDEKAHAAFVSALDAPPARPDALRRLLARPSPWEK